MYFMNNPISKVIILIIKNSFAKIKHLQNKKISSKLEVLSAVAMSSLYQRKALWFHYIGLFSYFLVPVFW